MVMTKSGGVGISNLTKDSSNNKARSFDQEGSSMDPIDVEPLRSVDPTAIVPYGKFEDEDPAVEAFR